MFSNPALPKDTGVSEDSWGYIWTICWGSALTKLSPISWLICWIYSTHGWMNGQIFLQYWPTESFTERHSYSAWTGPLIKCCSARRMTLGEELWRTPDNEDGGGVQRSRSSRHPFVQVVQTATAQFNDGVYKPACWSKRSWRGCQPGPAIWPRGRQPLDCSRDAAAPVKVKKRWLERSGG